MLKTNRNLIKLAIVCLGVQNMSADAVTPALQSIIEAFPAVNPSLIMMLATIPSFCMVIFSPVYVKMSEIMKKRTILKIAAFCVIVGGIGEAFYPNLYFIFFMRIIQSAGIAFVLPMGYDLVCAFFEGQERQTMMGWVNAAASLGGMLLQLLGGLLASISWRYCFLAYLSGLIFFGISLAFLPEPERQEELNKELVKVRSIKEKLKSIKEKFSIPFIGWAYSILHTMFFICIFGLMTNTSTIIVGEKLSNATGAGLALSLTSLGCMVASFFYGGVYKKLKYSALPLTYVIAAAAMGIGYFSHNLLGMCLMCLVAGIAMGLDIPLVFSRTTESVPLSKAAVAIVVPNSMGAIGVFVQPGIYDVIFRMTDTFAGRPSLLISLIGFVLVAVAALVLNRWDKSYGMQTA